MRRSRTNSWVFVVLALLAGFFLGAIAEDHDLLSIEAPEESHQTDPDSPERPGRRDQLGTTARPDDAGRPQGEVVAPSVAPRPAAERVAAPPTPPPVPAPAPPPLPLPTAAERAQLARALANPAFDRSIHDILAKLAPAERVTIYDAMDAQQRHMDALSLANSRLKSEIEHGAEPADAESAARAGKLRFSLNESGLSEQPLDESLVSDLGLSADQKATVEEMLRSQTDGLYDELHDLLVEQTGDPAAGAGYNTVALIEAIRESSSREEFTAAIDLIAREVAGQATPPADPGAGSVAERMLRAAMSHDRCVRDALVRLLGEELAEAFMNHASNKGTFYSFEASDGVL